MPRPKRTKKDLAEAIVRQVCAEFGVSPRELLEQEGEAENLLLLITLALFEELADLSPRISARRRLQKYLKFIPGLRKTYEKLGRRLKEKADGF